MECEWMLPDGQITEDAGELERSWTEMAAPLMDLMGVDLRAFDPGLCFVDHLSGFSFSLPTEVVRRVNKYLPESDFGDVRARIYAEAVTYLETRRGVEKPEPFSLGRR